MSNQADKFYNPEEDIPEKIVDALADYFEKRASDASVQPTDYLELNQFASLLNLPGGLENNPARLDAAWTKFRQQVWGGAALQPATLGGYVAQALQDDAAKTVSESGLSRAALDSLTSEATPMAELPAIELPKAKQIATRHGMPNEQVMSMVKWLRGIGRMFTNPTNFNAHGRLVFTRDETAPSSSLSPEELAKLLKPEPQLEQPAAEAAPPPEDKPE